MLHDCVKSVFQDFYIIIGKKQQKTKLILKNAYLLFLPLKNHQYHYELQVLNKTLDKLNIINAITNDVTMKTTSYTSNILRFYEKSSFYSSISFIIKLGLYSPKSIVKGKTYKSNSNR